MIIIGVDFHPEFQQIAWVNTETGEWQGRRLQHREEGESFYRELAGRAVQVRVGMEARGHARWFERLLGELQIELWIGDAAEIRTKRVRKHKQKMDRQDAQLILKLMLKDDFPRIWVPSWENRDLRQLLWHRHRMVQARTRIMNQLQAVALNEGLRCKKRLWRTKRPQLESFQLAPSASRRRRDLLELLDRLNPTIAELSQAIEQEVERSPEAQRLATHPRTGVGLRWTGCNNVTCAAERARLKFLRGTGNLHRLHVSQTNFCGGRTTNADFKYVYVNQDGSVRELSSREKDYLSEWFPPSDSGRPYIKRSYEELDGWGSMSGFMLRRKVPSKITVQPVNLQYDALAADDHPDFFSDHITAGDIVVKNPDGSGSVTPNPNISLQDRFEILRRLQLERQLKREQLARHPSELSLCRNQTAPLPALEVGLKAESVNPAATTKRRVFARLSIAVGNVSQIAGILAACLALSASRTAHSTAIAVITMVLTWVLLYFSSHAIAHWLVGRVVGIRFLFYTVGGTGNPQGWPPGLRWIFERLPFFGVQTEKVSMQNATPGARALMWSAGVTSSAIIPTLSAFWAWRFGVPGSKLFFLFALFWALGTLASNWTSRTGDYSKARRALGHS